MEALRQRDDSVIANYPNKYEWCGKIGARAEAVGKVSTYDLAYAEGCAASHSGPQGLRHVYVATDDDPNTLTYLLGAQEPDRELILKACTSYLDLLATDIDSCGLSQLSAPYRASVGKLVAIRQRPLVE